MSMNWFKYSSPQTFFPLAGRLALVFGALALLACAVGLYLGFFVAPTDAQQGESYRIIFIHVPAAWMSMFLYVVMAFLGGARARVQHAAVGHDGERDRADRSAVYFHRALDGVVLGQATWAPGGCGTRGSPPN